MYVLGTVRNNAPTMHTKKKRSELNTFHMISQELIIVKLRLNGNYNNNMAPGFEIRTSTGFEKRTSTGFQIKSAVQYMKNFMYHFIFIPHRLIRTHK